MPKSPSPPSISETAFDCPHCSAFSSHLWFNVAAMPLFSGNRTPVLPKAALLEPNSLAAKLVSASSRIGINAESNSRTVSTVDALYLSRCFNCQGVGVWRHRTLVDPPLRVGIEPNSDLPIDVQSDFNEARAIVAVSPRGAAALLRLALQKLCVNTLKAEGDTIDKNIASLVSKGLPVIISQALDIVRVIGNEAVHPGTIDLEDDAETATELFRLINIIADHMITNPKNIATLYASLPEAKRKAIDVRNEKAVRDTKNPEDR